MLLDFQILFLLPNSLHSHFYVCRPLQMLAPLLQYLAKRTCIYCAPAYTVHTESVCFRPALLVPYFLEEQNHYMNLHNELRLG